MRPYYTYTTNGLLASVTNANGHFVAYDYDDYGYLKEVDPSSRTNDHPQQQCAGAPGGD